MPDPTAPDHKPDTGTKPGFFQIALSVIAAAFGVQSDANRQRDFSQASPLAFIIGGILFTVLFVLTLVGIVMLVVH